MDCLRDALTEGAPACLLPPAASLDDRSVVVATRDQRAAVLALIELDGVARRLVLCPPDAMPWLPGLARRSGADAIVSDVDVAGAGVEHLHQIRYTAAASIARHRSAPAPRDTEWVLLTSGTAGTAKMVRHTFSTLTAAIAAQPPSDQDAARVVWGTFYDVRRYGGLQIVLRALVRGASLVLGAPGESVSSYLDRLAACGATNVSGTPTHWRRVLMNPHAGAIAPDYIRLSGEIADQAILDALHARYPRARVAHAFASTESGVGFEVTDGLAGFPADLVDRTGDVAIRVDDGSLRIRSRGAAHGYLDDASAPLRDDDGFVDTGDVVERRGDRYYFLGRRSGVINVGGLKVHPEEVEAAINRHPSVRGSKVCSRHSPITGALVAADVVLDRAADADGSRREILQLCRETLRPHQVPAVIRIVSALDLSSTGKLARHAS